MTIDSPLITLNLRNMLVIYIYIYILYIYPAAGWSSGNTLAHHTGHPGSIPGRGGSSGKCESIWGDFSSPTCNTPSLIRGTGELSVFALFPLTRHNRELVEAQPWTNRSITHPPAFTAHMHTQVEGGHNREICTSPLKKVGAMRHSP